MCGFAGIAGRLGSRVDPHIVEKMTTVLTHRGPDDCGYYHDGEVALGHRRLSIIDVKGGHQPMFNEDKTLCLVYNGEIYNYKELRDDLKVRGHIFSTKCDSETIIHAYEEYGETCVERFNGMFAFAIWDRKRHRLFIARDRLGIKPLYYAKVGDRLLISSEIKAILQYSEFVREVNLRAISSYLTFRTCVGEETVFNGIYKLLPGHILIYHDGTIQVTKYWDIPFFEKKEDAGETYYLEKIGELLRKAVKRRMMSDVPLGTYLSGGLDSSVVVALMHEISGDPIKTFSIGFKERGYNEFEYSRTVSEIFGTEHREICLSMEDYMEILPKMIRQKDAPLSIPHEVALYQMSKELKKYITVVISGEGADELFGGYGRVQRSPMDYQKILFFQNRVPPFLKKAILKLMGRNGNITKLLSINSHMRHFFHVYNWIPFDDKWGLFTDEVMEEISRDKDLIGIFKELFDKMEQVNPYDRILFIFEKIHLVNLLDRLDAMSMAASVEARVPFVDHELVEFVSAIPYTYKLRWKSLFHKFLACFVSSFKASERLDTSKYLLRKFAWSLLPDEIVHRKKLGFPVPLDHWIKGSLNRYAREVLLDDRVKRRGYFKVDGLERLINSNERLGYDFFGKRIWMLMNVELWFREFFD